MISSELIGINDKHLADLRASGLTDATIRAACIRTETDAAKVAELLGWKNAKTLGASLVFPFFDPDGKPNGYAFAKPDRPRTNDKGKLRKYELPKGKPNRAYIPPATRARVADANALVFVTEGCKKTLAANQHGYACIGISGVWNWCQKHQKGAEGKNRGPFKLIPDLASIVWKGRVVLIVFDSDAATNPNVRLAEWKLAEVLRAAGAVVKVVRLPSEPDGAKNGLDDYLVRHGAEKFAALVEAAQVPEQPVAKEKEKPPAAADVLTAIGTTFDLWHDSTQTAYASNGRDTRAVRSKAFRHLLVKEYRQQTSKTPNADALANALTAIEAGAVCDGPERAAHVRIAGHDGRVYLHLADGANTVIEIDCDGWRECEQPPVHFRKPAGILALPKPDRGGSLADLRALINVPDDAAFALVKAWLSGCFRPDGPFPLLVLTGEQGSAKTTTGHVLKRLIDPSAAPLRSEPKEARDLMIAARNAHVAALDNLSRLHPWLSDALCRLATGGGFGTRALYTDDEEMIFDAKRPVILNGIENFVTRGDLLERSILLQHPPIPEEKRKPESELWAAFDTAHPKLLGALLDRVAAGLRELPRVKLDQLPRAADFALFAVACERGAGETPQFIAAYSANQSDAHAQALDGSPVPAALVKFMGSRDQWSGTAAELLGELTPLTPKPDAKDWPKAANALTNKLRRLASDLRKVHRLNIQTKRGNAGCTVTITRLPDTSRETSSPSSPPTPHRENTAVDGDDVRDDPRGAQETSSPASSRRNTGKTSVSDAGDAGDDVSPVSSGHDTEKPRRRYVNDDRPFDQRYDT